MSVEDLPTDCIGVISTFLGLHDEARFSSVNKIVRKTILKSSKLHRIEAYLGCLSDDALKTTPPIPKYQPGEEEEAILIKIPSYTKPIEKAPDFDTEPEAYIWFQLIKQHTAAPYYEAYSNGDLEITKNQLLTLIDYHTFLFARGFVRTSLYSELSSKIYKKYISSYRGTRVPAFALDKPGVRTTNWYSKLVIDGYVKNGWYASVVENLRVVVPSSKILKVTGTSLDGTETKAEDLGNLDYFLRTDHPVVKKILTELETVPELLPGSDIWFSGNSVVPVGSPARMSNYKLKRFKKILKSKSLPNIESEFPECKHAIDFVISGIWTKRNHRKHANDCKIKLSSLDLKIPKFRSLPIDRDVPLDPKNPAEFVWYRMISNNDCEFDESTDLRETFIASPDEQVAIHMYVMIGILHRGTAPFFYSDPETWYSYLRGLERPISIVEFTECMNSLYGKTKELIDIYYNNIDKYGYTENSLLHIRELDPESSDRIIKLLKAKDLYYIQ